MIVSNLYCQVNNRVLSLKEYSDSVENAIRSSSYNPESEIKHFRRGLYLMKSRMGKNFSMEPYYRARTNYYNSISGALKSSDVDDIEWEFFGPTGIPEHHSINASRYSTGKGWIYSIFIDDSDNDKILAGSHSAGLWKTSNHGNSWTPLTDEEDEILGINSILQNEDTIIITSHHTMTRSYSTGLFRSEDGGNTWEDINNGDLETLYPTTKIWDEPRKLYRNPFSSNEIFYLTFSSVFKSTDNGEDWTELFTNSDNTKTNSKGLYDIEIVQDASNNETIYISGSKIHKSTNGGSSWTNITASVTGAPTTGLSNVDSVERTEMATNPIYDDKVWFYFKYGSSSYYLVKYSGSSYAFLKSRTSQTVAQYKMECEISPNNEEIVYIAGLNIRKYNEATDSFTQCSECYKYIDNSEIYGGTDWVHADIRDLKIINNSGVDRIYAAHDGGISWGEWDNSLSTPGYNFRHISDDGTDGLYVTEFWGFDVADTNKEMIVGGCQDLSLFVYGAPGYSNTWIHSEAGDGNECEIDDSNTNYVYGLDFYNNYLHRSSNGGVSFSDISVNNSPQTKLTLDPNNHNVLYVGDVGRLIRFNDIKNSLTDKTSITPPSIGSSSIISIAVDPNNSDNIYTSSSAIIWNIVDNPTCSNIMWKTTDRGTNWTSISQNLKGSLDYNPCQLGMILDIEINPDNSSEIWTCFSHGQSSNKVFHSENGGSTWEVLSNGYPTGMPAQELIYDEVAALLYVSTDVGVFYWDELLGWKTMGTDLPRVIISDIDLNSVTGKIYAATYGRGIWVADLPEENCYGNHSDIDITTNTTWSANDVKCGNISVLDGATLTITAEIFQNPRYSFHVDSSSELIINGGNLDSGPLEIEYGGKFSVINGGEITVMQQ